MRKQEISFKKVALAAASVKKQGKEPSLNAISEELGISSATPQLGLLFDKWCHLHKQLHHALHDALKKKEFYLVYQPLMDLRAGCAVGIEALVRWHSPLLGRVSSMDFIGIAEETDLIIDIGRWVLEEACNQVVRWHQQGFRDLSVAVNISGRQFYKNRLPKMVTEILNKTGLAAQFLELELTESLLVKDVSHTVYIMNKLKAMGVQLVIDDFGIGYANLSYLKEFPVDKIKLDRSFLLDLVNKKNNAAIAQAIINLGHDLHLKVLAEGVETAFQKDFVISHGCDYAQGYYFKPPDTAKALHKFLEKYANK